MAKHKQRKDDPPRIEDFVGGKDRRVTSRRRSITLWLDGDIIDACKPHPAKVLRQWLEAHYLD